MRRSPISWALMAPALILLFFWIRPQADPALQAPLFHFYIVTFTSFAATVVSFLLVATLGPVAHPRHVLAAVAFALMGTLFVVHGLTTPGAIIPASHPAVPAIGWAAWLTLFVGGVVFSLAGTGRSADGRFPLPPIVIALTVGVLVFISVVLVIPHWLQLVESGAGPWHRRLLFFSSLGVWIVAALQFWRKWRRWGHVIDGTLAVVATLLVQATVSMHLFPVWRLSWWLYHALLLVGFLVTAFVLFRSYEQARQFRLVPYYLAASLILTALLALVASHLFNGFARRISSDGLEQTLNKVLRSYTATIAANLPEGMPAPTVREAYAQHLDHLPLDAGTIYDPQGRYVFGDRPLVAEVGHLEGNEVWEAVLAGQTVLEVRSPGEPPPHGLPTAAGEANVHTVYGYVALPTDGEPAGVLVTEMAAPELAQVTMRARVAGLLGGSLTMGLLLVALLVVVRRADRIITTRSQELAVANRDLRRSEAMRDDLTQMIVHDLRSPLTAILTNLGLLRRLPGSREEAQAGLQGRVVERTTRAARRLERMIDDILAVGKIESGELSPQRERVQVATLLDRHLDPFMLRASAEGKALEVECPTDLKAQLDPELTGRMLENLISNAFKYTRSGGKIAVSASGENGTLRMSVRDDGQGIPDEFKEHVFGKFAQIPAESSNSTRKGTGLGLAFCRLVVDAHGGQIWVEDAPGGGSNFQVSMPLAR